LSDYQRIFRQKVLRQAEGYLDLVLAFADQWPLDATLRDRLAHRALEALDRLPPQSDQQAPVAYLTGQAYRTMRRYREAIPPLELAAELDPENIPTWLALGWCYKRSGQLDLAIQALESALAVDSGEAIIHYNLACYWSLADNTRLAVRFLTQAFEIDPAYRALVADEPDFDPIRQHPDFQSLMNVTV
jgi:Flp pilus assembly protein TadD